MMRGLRTKAMPIDGFRAFVAARGAIFDEPKQGSGEILRFRIDCAHGRVSKRKDGCLTFSGIARPLYERARENMNSEGDHSPLGRQQVAAMPCSGASNHRPAREPSPDASPAFFLWIRNNGSVAPQLWREDPRQYPSWASEWRPRVACGPIAIAGEDAALTLDQLAKKYPCPPPKEDT